MWIENPGPLLLEVYMLEAPAIFQEKDDKFGQSQALCIIGDLALVNHNFEKAKSHFESALALSREISDLDEIAYHLYKLAQTTIEQTPIINEKLAEQTRDLLTESLKIF
jgi:uncharacterized protein HemY